MIVVLFFGLVMRCNVVGVVLVKLVFWVMIGWFIFKMIVLFWFLIVGVVLSLICISIVGLYGMGFCW